VLAVKHQLKRVTVAILSCASFHSLCCLNNRKGKSLNEQCFYRNNKIFCGINSYNTYSNAVFRHSHSFCHSFIALPMIRCSKSAEKFAVQVCQDTAVVMESTQLVLSQFNKNLAIANRSRVSCAHNTLRASIGINITP